MSGPQDIQPVRAWAEYDKWSVFVYESEINGYETRDTPKGASDELVAGWALGFEHVFMDANPEHSLGALRSLRVLLSNGAWVTIFPAVANWWWNWTLLDQDEEPDSGGSFQCESDAEAVERALAEATAWFSAQESSVSA